MKKSRKSPEFGYNRRRLYARYFGTRDDAGAEHFKFSNKNNGFQALNFKIFSLGGG